MCFTDNPIGDEGAKALGVMLQMNKSLKTLYYKSKKEQQGVLKEMKLNYLKHRQLI